MKVDNDLVISERSRDIGGFTVGRLLPWCENNHEYTLTAGEGIGRRSPVPLYSGLFMIEARSGEKGMIPVDGNLSGEIGICVVEGCRNEIEQAKSLWREKKFKMCEGETSYVPLP